MVSEHDPSSRHELDIILQPRVFIPLMTPNRLAIIVTIMVLNMVTCAVSVVLIIQRRHLHPISDRRIKLVVFHLVVCCSYSVLSCLTELVAGLPCSVLIVWRPLLLCIACCVYLNRVLLHYMKCKHSEMLVARKRDSWRARVRSLSALHRHPIAYWLWAAGVVCMFLPILMYLYTYANFEGTISTSHCLPKKVVMVCTTCIVGIVCILLLLIYAGLIRRSDNWGIRKEILGCFVVSILESSHQMICEIFYCESESTYLNHFKYGNIVSGLTVLGILGFAGVYPVWMSYRMHNLERIKSKGEKLEIILKNSGKLYARFKQHLLSELSVENLMFYEEVAKFQRLMNARQMLRSRDMEWTVAESIYYEYIAPGAPSEINVSFKDRQAVTEAIEISRDKWVDATVFDKVQAEVFRLISRDSLPRFLRVELDYLS